MDTMARRQRRQPPTDMVERLRIICSSLDGAIEHEAWTGTSWRVHGITFAHLVCIDEGWPPAYARAFETGGPATVLTFQADDMDREALASIGHPFHLPPWRPGIVGLVLSAETEWAEVFELVEDSHEICATPGPDP
jgi:hypothetical protein